VDKIIADSIKYKKAQDATFDNIPTRPVSHTLNENDDQLLRRDSLLAEDL
jgi:hypothetical protein